MIRESSLADQSQKSAKVVLGRNARSKNPEENQYAFYSEDAPGKGVEILFSEYEAFAVHLGLRLLAHGWPQTFVVSVLRKERAALKSQHRRILKQKTASYLTKKRS